MCEIQKDPETRRQSFVLTLNYLLQNHAGLNVKDRDGLTPLHYAARNNNELAARRMLREWAIKLDVSFYKVLGNQCGFS